MHDASITKLNTASNRANSKTAKEKTEPKTEESDAIENS